MKLYYRTSSKDAQAILDGGFPDGEGTYMTGMIHCGVWLSDRPLDANDGVLGDVIFCVSIPEALVQEYEWYQDYLSYREFLCPAELVNRHRPFTVVDEEGGPVRPPDAIASLSPEE